MNDIAAIGVLANDHALIVDVCCEGFNRPGEINLGEIACRVPHVAVEAVDCGVCTIATHDLTLIIDLAGNGLDGAGEIDLCENAIAEQETVAVVGIEIPEASDYLARRIDAPAACVDGVRDSLDIECGKDAIRENEAMKASDARGVAILSHNRACDVDTDGSRIEGAGKRDIEWCEPAIGVPQIAMFDVVLGVGVVSHDLAENVYPVALCLDWGEPWSERNIKRREDKALCPDQWSKTQHQAKDDQA